VNYPLVFEYMEWCIIENCTFNGTLLANTKDKILDGNDMIAAMNKMVEKEDWAGFFTYISFPYLHEFNDENKNIHWLMQPDRFFDLMEAWIKENNK